MRCEDRCGRYWFKFRTLDGLRGGELCDGGNADVEVSIPI